MNQNEKYFGEFNEDGTLKKTPARLHFPDITPRDNSELLLQWILSEDVVDVDIGNVTKRNQDIVTRYCPGKIQEIKDYYGKYYNKLLEPYTVKKPWYIRLYEKIKQYLKPPKLQTEEEMFTGENGFIKFTRERFKHLKKQ